MLSKPLLKIVLKYPISYLDKSCIVYRFNCFCDTINIGQTSLHLKTMVKEHVCEKLFIECEKLFIVCEKLFIEGKKHQNNSNTKC